MQSFALALAVLIAILFLFEARLNHNEPGCRVFAETYFTCAEHGEPASMTTVIAQPR